MITEIKCDDHWLQKVYGLPSSWATELYFRIFKLGNRTIFQDIFATVSIVFFPVKRWISKSESSWACFRVYPQFMTIVVGIVIFQGWNRKNILFQTNPFETTQQYLSETAIAFRISPARLRRRDFNRHWWTLMATHRYRHWSIHQLGTSVVGRGFFPHDFPIETSIYSTIPMCPSLSWAFNWSVIRSNELDNNVALMKNTSWRRWEKTVDLPRWEFNTYQNLKDLQQPEAFCPRKGLTIA